MWTDVQYQEFVDDAYAYLTTVQDAIKKDFNLGVYERYDWDQELGTRCRDCEGCSGHPVCWVDFTSLKYLALVLG